MNKFTATGEVDETYLDTGAVDEKDLSVEHLKVVLDLEWSWRMIKITRGKLPLN